MIDKYLMELVSRYPDLEREQHNIEKAYEVLVESFSSGGKLLIAGNGGSSADAEHIVGELMKGFVKPRKPDQEFVRKLIDLDAENGVLLAANLQGGLPAIALSGHASLTTAYLNDVDGNLCFAQQTYGYGSAGDVLLAITTSGNSQNVLHAVTVARAKGMKIIGLSGGSGGRINDCADVTIIAPASETYKIQELHLPVYHTLCLMLEEYFF